MGGVICVYTITNKNDGKVYVGKTKDPKMRWVCHRYEGRHLRKRGTRISHSQLYVAMHAEGEASFEFAPIEWCESDEDACAAERYWIEWYRSMDPAHGYNGSTGGWGSTGHVPPAHKRAQASALFKGKTQDRRFVARRVAPRLGLTPEECLARWDAGERYCAGAGVNAPHWAAETAFYQRGRCRNCDNAARRAKRAA